SWPMATRAELEPAGATAAGEPEPPHETAPMPPEPEQAEHAKAKTSTLRNRRRPLVAQAFRPANGRRAATCNVARRALKFMTFSVYLPAPIRSSAASAITFVAFTRSSMRHDSSGW